MPSLYSSLSHPPPPITFLFSENIKAYLSGEKVTKELPKWILEAAELSFHSLWDGDCHCVLDPAGVWAKMQPPDVPSPVACGMMCSLPHRNPWNLGVKASVMLSPSCEQMTLKNSQLGDEGRASG